MLVSYVPNVLLLRSPCECSVRFTDHNLHISSSVRYLGTAQGCCYPLGVTSMTWNSNGLNVELERAFADGSVALSRRSSIPMTSAICTLAHEQLELFKLKMLFTFLSCQWKIPGDCGYRPFHLGFGLCFNRRITSSFCIFARMARLSSYK